MACLLDDGTKHDHLLCRVVLQSTVLGSHDNLRSLERDNLVTGKAYLQNTESKGRALPPFEVLGSSTKY